MKGLYVCVNVLRAKHTLITFQLTLEATPGPDVPYIIGDYMVHY
jgi:hypothetical protein